jgi:hypothetical protein
LISGDWEGDMSGKDVLLSVVRREKRLDERLRAGDGDVLCLRRCDFRQRDTPSSFLQICFRVKVKAKMSLNKFQSAGTLGEEGDVDVDGMGKRNHTLPLHLHPRKDKSGESRTDVGKGRGQQNGKRHISLTPRLCFPSKLTTTSCSE